MIPPLAEHYRNPDFKEGPIENAVALIDAMTRQDGVRAVS